MTAPLPTASLWIAPAGDPRSDMATLVASLEARSAQHAEPDVITAHQARLLEQLAARGAERPSGNRALARRRR